jgi:endonuclease/exonuclease/phosphatase family metal-dependent hydrolase
MQLKLATYNIHRCIGTDKVRDPQRTGDVLDEIGADIIALQEVEYLHTINELDFVGTDLGFETVAGPTVTTERSKYGNLLISRYPVEKKRKINLSYPGQEHRGAIDVDIRYHEKLVRVIATHLGLSPIERRKQTKILLDMIINEKEERSATILMGDMNEWFLWGRPLRWIHKYFGHKKSAATYPSRFPVLSLDRIWCHPFSFIHEIRPHCSKLSRLASDHLPLTAKVFLGGSCDN